MKLIDKYSVSDNTLDAVGLVEREDALHTPFSVGESRRRFPCRANVAHLGQPKLAYGLGSKANVLKTFRVVPISLGSGPINGSGSG